MKRLWVGKLSTHGGDIKVGHVRANDIDQARHELAFMLQERGFHELMSRWEKNGARIEVIYE